MRERKAGGENKNRRRRGQEWSGVGREERTGKRKGKDMTGEYTRGQGRAKQYRRI